MNGPGITIVGASAGSGKTHRLTREVTTALSGANRIDVTSLVAVTFTRKAHAELEARIRERLIADEAFDDALRLPLSYVGTIHAAALRLLQELALEAGLSPTLDVVAGNETKLLREAFERTLDAETRVRLEVLAAAVELDLDRQTRRTDWIRPCADIMDLARSNRINPEALVGMATDSSDGLLALLPAAVGDGAQLDEGLARELVRARERLAGQGDGTAKTAQAVDLLSSSLDKLTDGELRWSGWAKLATIAPSKKCDHIVASLRLAAARYEEHPRFHGDIRALIHGIFSAASAGLVAYRDWKRERRVIDYIDMLDGALQLLDDPTVRAELAERLRLVVVDEFQDTSPIQLALFLRFHDLARRSVWVGDRKQCIFEYAGADPALMDSVADWVSRAGGVRDRLEFNFRSRPELVRCCSELFAAALARHGFSREEVVVEPKRVVPPELSRLPPLGIWTLDGTSKDGDAHAIAHGVKRMLADPHRTPVVDRATGAVRPVRAGDIAVLAATNQWADALAVALHALGVRVSIARTGLFATPEGTLIDSALRWVIDAHDELAAANLDALAGGWLEGKGDDWLEHRIRAIAADAVPETADGWRASLDSVRARLTLLSPTEALDLTLEALDAARICARWPDASQRVANLDALRAMAMSYEARCAQERQAATLAGLIRYFDSTRLPTLQRDEMLPSDDQHVPSDDSAVVICTYHKSKGLEWPVVILANLDRSTRRTAFEAAPETLSGTFDAEHPLVGRSIRYWPWPLGAIEKAPLAERAAQSPAGRAVSQRETRERARLLYVGFTRARDHLVLAIRLVKGKPLCGWLESLAVENERIMKLPVDAEDGTIAETRLGVDVQARVWRLGAREERERIEPTTPRWFERPAQAAPRIAYRITPSNEMIEWPALAREVAQSRIGRIERISSGVALRSRLQSYDVLGQAIHGFLAADVAGVANDARRARARGLIDGWGVAATLDADALIEASEVFSSWVNRRWPGALWHRELPIEGPVATETGERWLSGIVDLLIETAEGYVLFDHKSFPAPNEAAWRVKCEGFIPQVLAYATLLEGLGAKRVMECWIHLPVGGGVVEISRSSSRR